MQQEGFDHLRQHDFERLAGFIERYSGIKMPPTKITMVEGRLRRRLRATGLASLTEYCQYLFDDDGLESEAVHLIDAITTNKTEFFREPEHFRFLAEIVVPRLLAERRTRPPIKIWSAACSIGAEPYTLAMVLADLERRHAGLRATITATDICTEVLTKAIAGIYPESMVEPVPPELRHRYVRRGKGRSRHLVRVAPELRAMVRFGRLNLMEAPYSVDSDQDIIFCRNILIYFEAPTQEAVLQLLIEHLAPGGYLFLGHSETLTSFHLPLRPVAPTVFRRM